jgi:hypothetical protein
LSCWCRIKTKSAKLCLGFISANFFRLAQFNPLLGHLDPLANDANFYVHVNLNSCRLYCLSHLIPATIHMFSPFFYLHIHIFVAYQILKVHRTLHHLFINIFGRIFQAHSGAFFQMGALGILSLSKISTLKFDHF